VFNDLILQFSARKKLIQKGANTKHLSPIGGDLFTSATGSHFFLGVVVIFLAMTPLFVT
jgi:hypothetical protein